MTSFIPALLVKLTLILALGLILAASLRASAPSLRHLVLFATLASGLALPVVMLLSPQWDVPVLPSFVTPTYSASPNGTTVRAAADRAPTPFADARSTSAVANAPASRVGSNTGSVLNVAAALPLLWIVGLAGVLGWLTIGRIRLRRITATSWPLRDADWKTILDEERRESSVEKPVRLFSSSVVSTPLTWGSRSPVILLPEDALDWPEEHRRIVLRHELAHVARDDAFSQLIAGIVCALYWFHPLVWAAERRQRAECERACDDRVVSLGTPAPEYAAHLLEVARSARAFGAPGFLSVAMARPSQLEGRLLAVLNGSRQRVALARGARWTAVVLSALVLLPLAAFRAVPKPIKTVGVRVADAPRVSTTVSAASSEGSSVATAATALADTTFQLSAPVRSGGTLELDLRTGGNVIITGWDKSEVQVRASLSGRDWRETEVKLTPSGTGATLESDFTTRSNNQSTRHRFTIQVPKNFNVRLRSSGGAISINGVDGSFTGNTGGGEINIQKSNGDVDISTGGGEIYVTDSHLNGNVSTGGGMVRIIGVSGGLSGSSGSGPVIYTDSEGEKHLGLGGGSGKGKGASVSVSGNGSNSATISTNGRVSTSISTKDGSGTTTYINDGGGQGIGGGSSGIRMSSAGGAISLPSAPNGARVTTGGGRIRIGPSGGEVYASTGGGDIEIGPASGSVDAHTGAGDVRIELKGTGPHAVDVTSGKGEVVLVLPRDLDATLEIESAYTNNLGHKTSIVSDWPVQSTETANWDARDGTPRKYVRVSQNIGRGGGVIRVRTVNGNVVLTRAP